jgi:hypothetical protein
VQLPFSFAITDVSLPMELTTTHYTVFPKENADGVKNNWL